MNMDGCCDYKYVVVLMDACGYMDDIHLSIDHLCHFHGFIDNRILQEYIPHRSYGIRSGSWGPRFPYFFRSREERSAYGFPGFRPICRFFGLKYGEANCPSSHPCPPWIRTMSKPASLTSFAASPNACAVFSICSSVMAFYRHALCIHFIVGTDQGIVGCLMASCRAEFSAMRKFHGCHTVVFVEFICHSFQRGKGHLIIKDNLFGMRTSDSFHDSKTDADTGESAFSPVRVEGKYLLHACDSPDPAPGWTWERRKYDF